MNIIDVIIPLILLVGFILGFKDGFVRKLIGLIGFAAAIILTINFAGDIGRVIETVFKIEFYLAEIIGGIAIFSVIILFTSIIKRVVHPFDKVNNLINQIGGGAIGIIQILFFLSAVLFILKIFDIPTDTDSKGSFLYSRVYNVIPDVVDYISDQNPQSKNFIKDFINERDTAK